jgi:hypothetical protein
VNNVLRRIFGTNKADVGNKWTEFHNKKLHNFNSSPGIVRVIKSEG